MEIKLLSCPLCLHPHFTSVDSLRTALINVASAPIPCPICNDVLMGLDKLTIHLFSHVTFSITINTGNNSEIGQLGMTAGIYVQKKIVALVPAAKNEEKDIQQVVTIEKEKPDFNILQANKHDNSNIQCDICNFRFNDQSILDMHQKLLHQTLADTKTGACSYHCHLCSKRFKMKGSLMIHLRVAHAGFGCQTQSDSCQESESCQNNANSTTEGLKVAGGMKQWACDICEKTFTTKYFLKKHKRLHTGEMPYFCSQCNKSFTFQQSFHKHMMYHTADKPHVCPECNRAFKELSTLQNHQRIHSGERPFACESCGKCFRQRVSYLVHRRIHTGVMPYTCNVCNKSFRYKVSQKSHKCVNPNRSDTVANELLVSSHVTNLIKSQEDKTDVLNFNIPTQQYPRINNNNTNNQSPELSLKINNNDISFQMASNAEGTAYYAMVLSPTSIMLPDVQSLCLTSDRDQLSTKDCQNDVSSSDVMLVNDCAAAKSIDEESLKLLLYSSMQ